MIRVYIVNAGRKESFILTTQASLGAQTSTGGEHYSALLWVLTLYSELLTDPFGKYCLSKGVELLCLRLSDVREAGRTLPVALMGEKEEKRETAVTCFTAYVMLQQWKIQASFLTLTGCNNIQPSSRKSALLHASVWNFRLYVFLKTRKKKPWFENNNILVD